MRVILYCRVSTDEQKDGYSLDVQEQRLREYCDRNGYDVVEVVTDNYSAKDHNLKRPGLKYIFEYCKTNKKSVDKLLFLRWDRFSRNVEFAFTYRRKFFEMGVEINSIESPIDFYSPDWSTMLGIYCGTAHTEDDKISSRTRDGMYGAALAGKYLHKAPVGYRNVRKSKHETWLEVDEAEAKKVKELFEEIAKGVEAPLVVKKRVWPELPKNTFFHLIKNRVYIGEVKVPEYMGEKSYYVKGAHKPIVERETFFAVQDIMAGKKHNHPKLSKTPKPNLYLRRFVVCPVCGHIMTGAESKGNGGKYTYYFCNHDHKHINIRAEVMNEAFVRYVSALKPNRAVLALYNEILNDMVGDNVKANKKEAEKLQGIVNATRARINRVNDSFFDGEISREDRDECVSRYKGEVAQLERQIEALKMSEDKGMKDKIGYSINIIENLGGFFSMAKPEVKIKLLGSIFPEKIQFDGENYRTNSYNQMLDVIYLETKQLTEKKTESNSKSHSQSQMG